MDLATFVARYLADASILGWVPLVRWDEQVRTWIDRARTSDRVLIVRYEDLHRDRRSVLEAISRFCRIPMSPQVIDLAVERSAFGGIDPRKRNAARRHISFWAAPRTARVPDASTGGTDRWLEK